MYNYNGVLQICAGFVNAAVYRLKKTWEKISKQVRAMMSGVYKDVVALILWQPLALKFVAEIVHQT